MIDPGTTTFIPALRIESISGPALDMHTLDPRRETLVGRGIDSDVSLLHESVSRRHVVLAHRAGRWLATDQHSRCGTILNGRLLEPDHPTELADGDLLGIGPWVLRISIGNRDASRALTVPDRPTDHHRVERLDSTIPGHLAQRQLALILECAGAIAAASSMRQIADAVVEAALGGLEFESAAIIVELAARQEVEVVSERSRRPGDGTSFAFSRSLLDVAAQGELARLTDLNQVPDAPVGASIASLGITAAMCVPILLGTSVAAYLYLDSRRTVRDQSHGHTMMHGDRETSNAAGFCLALSRLAGLALANLKRTELEQRQRRLEEEVAAAREVQLLLLPPAEGRAGPVRYALHSRPGRFVAGDLFDVMAIDDQRAAMIIGDVVGHGFGPAVLMASAQSHLNALLRREADVAAAVRSLNRDLASRDAAGRFITLWVGLIDRAAGTLTAVDAGHGYCLLRRGDATPEPLLLGRGIPVGIDDSFQYGAETVPFGADDRLLLFSDGLVEERRGRNVPAIDIDGVAQAMRAAGDARGIVRDVMAAVEQACGTDVFTDDTTVACVEWA